MESFKEIEFKAYTDAIDLMETALRNPELTTAIVHQGQQLSIDADKIRAFIRKEMRIKIGRLSAMGCECRRNGSGTIMRHRDGLRVWEWQEQRKVAWVKKPEPRAKLYDD